MSHLPLIIQREYLAVVGKKSFIFGVVLLPIILIGLCAVLPIALSQVKGDDKKIVAVVDDSGGFAPLIVDDEDYHYVTVRPAGDESLYDYYQGPQGEGLYAIVQIPADVEEHAALTIYSTQAVSESGLRRSLARGLEPELRRRRVEAYGIDSLAEIIEACHVRITTRSLIWDEKGGENLSSSELASVISMMLAMVAYIFVISFSAMNMSSVVEEKTNRIVEVLLASCKPLELMFGKIIANALIGLTLFAIWGTVLLVAVLVLSLYVAGDAAMEIGDIAAASAGMPAVMAEEPELATILQMLTTINYAQILTCFLLYGIGGYLLYASISSALGSLADTPNEATQFTIPIMLLSMFALYAGIFSIENPDGPLAWWCSLIPFTSPITMMVRLPYDVPFHEFLISLLLLYGTAFGFLWLSARIFRSGILMFGRKFKWKDIVAMVRRG